MAHARMDLPNESESRLTIEPMIHIGFLNFTLTGGVETHMSGIDKLTLSS